MDELPDSYTNDSLRRLPAWNKSGADGWWTEGEPGEKYLMIRIKTNALEHVSRLRIQLEPVKSIIEKHDEYLKTTSISIEARSRIIENLRSLLEQAKVEL